MPQLNRGEAEQIRKCSSYISFDARTLPFVVGPRLIWSAAKGAHKAVTGARHTRLVWADNEQIESFQKRIKHKRLH